ncbi:hypothetical protein SAMN04488498_11882 [Mesorhizobium albiziae]|uniref:Lipoprotein n=1 Tax=Neomesorhizobium albiziae TaxID=335020 RepID=A0A1I4DR88_9HYPH|nr:hypothetical protein [Mesorhizobium albiziae]GLS31275.1 hypothetical protein GCM10007937_29850 [Mesorhizobium albiziae]SFK94481.1 hypothetical protein SAMN04488498_11882 [Mesorhizobium albiziae]
MLVRSRLFCLALVFVVSACQTEDKRPQPRFVSDASETGNAVTSAYAPKTASHANASGYFIEFRSRYALSYGHTYVIFGRAQNGKMINPEVAGLHPSSDSEVPYVMGHFIPVPAETGWSDGDLEEGYRSASWRVMLSQSQYNSVVSNIRKLQASSPVWHAALYNCNAFVADIARSMGYKTPSIQLRPQQFVTELRQMNTRS